MTSIAIKLVHLLNKCINIIDLFKSVLELNEMNLYQYPVQDLARL